MSFENLKRNRKQNIEKLVQAVASTERASYSDNRFWKPTVDKSENGYAVIRFLPAAPNNDLPWVRLWDHGFKGPTGLWYIENSLTTLGQPDPVSEANSVLWNSGREEDKQIARDRKRRLHYISNIYVITDPGNPDNEGKVFLYQYGKKIFDKITDIMQPEFEDEQPMDPFDFWNGADFKLKTRKVEGYRNYDKSEFSSPSALFDDDDKLEKIYNSLYDLRELVDPKNFKSYDELQKKLNKVLNVNTTSNLSTAEQVDLHDASGDETPYYDNDDNKGGFTSSEEDKRKETLSYFKQLAGQN